MEKPSPFPPFNNLPPQREVSTSKEIQMNKHTGLRLSSTLLFLSLLAACSSTGGPHVAGSWEHIGDTNNGNIRAYLDKDSIKRNGQFVTFRDRKVVVKPEEERYVNTPRYKTAVGEWEIHCSNKTYRLVSLNLLNDDGGSVMQQNYTSVNLHPMPISNNTLTDKQYQFVCNKK